MTTLGSEPSIYDAAQKLAAMSPIALPSPPTPTEPESTTTTATTTTTAVVPDHHQAAAATQTGTGTTGIFEPRRGDPRTVIVVFNAANEGIVRVVADVLGRQWRTIGGSQPLSAATPEEAAVLGISALEAEVALSPPRWEHNRKKGFLVINTYCIDREGGASPDPALTDACDYEFLYFDSPYFRRDLARFLSHVLGQTSFHEELVKKDRSYFISTTFPDVRTALSNLDILTVGADAVELRVDLLKEPQPDGGFSEVPSLEYVGQQVMLLRQRTELPIIYTTRCTKENGRFPMADPDLFYRYLYRAIQWGVEYIDVELWLPEPMRAELAARKGSSRIISAYHDFSGALQWSSAEARRLFDAGTRHADIVKMIKIIRTMAENYSLQVFRSTIEALPRAAARPPLSAVNMGPLGQLSRALNTVFSPITHPLLPTIAAPGQMSAAEINHALHVMGQLPKRDIYAIGTDGGFGSSNGGSGGGGGVGVGVGVGGAGGGSPHQSVFFEKCFNELGLPHHFASVSRGGPRGSAEPFVAQPGFGGAYVHPPLPVAAAAAYVPVLTHAARCIRHVDTIVVRPADANGNSNSNSNSNGNGSSNNSNNGNENGSGNGNGNANGNSSGIGVGGGDGGSGSSARPALVGDNAAWKGIRATLTRDFVPSAYGGRAALVLAGSEGDAAAAIFALRSLGAGPVYTVGFKAGASSPLAAGLEPLTGVDSVLRVGRPFVIVNALAGDKAGLVAPLLRHYGGMKDGGGGGGGNGAGGGQGGGKVYVDLTAGPRKGDPVAVAAACGWTAYANEDVSAWTTVETLRLLVGQNVPFDFVRMASPRGIY